MSDRLSLPKDKIRVLLLEGINDSAAELFAAAGYTNVVRVAKALDREALHEALKGTHILGNPAAMKATLEQGGENLWKGARQLTRDMIENLLTVYEMCQVDGVVTVEIARAALAVYDVDDLGFDRLDRAVLNALIRGFGGGPVGVSTLAVAVSQSTGTVRIFQDGDVIHFRFNT